MPKNQDIIDYKPKSEFVVDYKSKSETIIDYKPKNEMVVEEMIDQLYSMTLGQNQWLGFSALTYPEEIVIQNSFSP